MAGKHEFTVGREPYDMPPSETLIHTLRDRLGLTAAKLGCGRGRVRGVYRDN